MTLRELRREPNPKLVKVVEDLLEAVKNGKVTALVAFTESGEVGKDAGLVNGGPINFGAVLGAFELWKMMRAAAILESGE